MSLCDAYCGCEVGKFLKIYVILKSDFDNSHVKDRGDILVTSPLMVFQIQKNKIGGFHPPNYWMPIGSILVLLL